ncbi:HNH endonuclease [Streptococcus suis]|nr:HNH endonuclease [Streptococcus suis]NQJ76036.1 HNH endonuclease [Streptococcus suis]
MPNFKFYKSWDWQKVRQQALKRDKYRCCWCYAAGKLTTARLEVDHIETVESRPDRALDLSNLRTLCRDCHNMRHNRFKSSDSWDDERFSW